MTTRRAFLAGSLVATLAACRGAHDPAAPRVLTVTDVHVEGYPTVEALKWLGARLAEDTGGRLSLRLYHSGQLGRENDAIDLARHGALDIARVHMGALNNPFPATRVLSSPYVFDSAAHLRRALDGAPGREILGRFADRGLVGLAFYDSGARCFYNTRRAIHAPAHLAGLKIRVPPSDIFMDTVRALGANPTPLPYGEVFSALQTRLIDGAENNWKTFHSTRQFEEARHFALTEHSYAPEALLLSRRTYDALNPADRERVIERARESVPVMRAMWDRVEAETRAAVIAAGVAVSEVDRAAFRAAAAPVLETYARADATFARLLAAVRALA